MQLRLELQQNQVADEVSAITAVVRPILTGLLYSIKQEVVADHGGYQDLRLRTLARVYRPGDGDCGICFEYAVHNALRNNEQTVTDRISTAMTRYCRMQAGTPSSILFGAEKAGAIQLIDTAVNLLTDDSRLLPGTRGQPVLLKRHIQQIAGAFRRQELRNLLPWSISGLWKADLFVGFAETDRWVATTVKINPTQLQPAKGLRIGIVPSREGRRDNIEVRGNLIVCPLPYDGAFMEVFYKGWEVVRQFIAADARVPSEVHLPRPASREVARYLADRRDFHVLDVVEALAMLAQPELLQTTERQANLQQTRRGEADTGAVLAPIASTVDA